MPLYLSIFGAVLIYISVGVMNLSIHRVMINDMKGAYYRDLHWLMRVPLFITFPAVFMTMREVRERPFDGEKMMIMNSEEHVGFGIALDIVYVIGWPVHYACKVLLILSWFFDWTFKFFFFRRS